MGIRTYGPNAVDWEERVDVERLRTQRLGRLKEALDRSELGALLSFDFHNIRYMTSTHIGTWAMDKLIRFALLPRGGEPVGVDLAELPVLAGRLTIHVGFDTHRLGPGDSISFPATTPHRLGNDATEPATAIWCIIGRHT